jgi:anti-sigma B factor antagonist
MDRFGVEHDGSWEAGLDEALPHADERTHVAEICAGQEVCVSGRLDVRTVAEVRLALHGVLDRGVGDLLIHLAQAEVCDATGLAVIVGVHHRARRLGRQLVLVDVSPRLDRLLRASRLNRALKRGTNEGALTVAPFTR